MIGESFALAAAFSFAVANVAISKASQQGGGGDNGAFLSMVLTALFSAILWVALPAVEVGAAAGSELWRGVGYFVLAGILATVFGRLALFKSVRLAGAVRASILRRTIPLFAAALAYIILGEVLSLGASVGLVLIVVSFVMLFTDKQVRAPAGKGADVSSRSLLIGQIYGLLSSLTYGAAFVARKLGLIDLPDAALGALISSLAALVWFAGAALVSDPYRTAIRELIRTSRRWQVVAASTMSLGQILQFFALKNADVAIVAIIGSVEIFLAAYLAVFLLRTEAMPNRQTIIASLIATAGVIMVALY